MKTTNKDVYQVVIEPGTPDTDRLMEEAEDLIGDDPKLSPWLSFKLKLSWVLHPVVHHYVPLKLYDGASQRIIETDHLTCLWCARTR